MLVDVVIDANVFLHADDEREHRRVKCQQILETLRACTTSLCVDDGFDLIESKNRSHIGSEYIKHLRFGMSGYAIVAHLASSSRIRMVSRTVPANVSKCINRQVSKGTDRIYIRVAHNSDDKVLASHDFGDIPQTVRVRLAEQIGVSVLAADEALEKLR